MTITPPGNQAGKVGTAVSLPMAATDSDPAVTTFAWGDTGLPPGLAIAPATGVISGTPTTAGTYPVTVTATDASGATDTVGFTWTIAKPPNVITVTAPGAEKSTVGVAITPVRVTATDSAAGQTLTFSAAGLPPGLKINAASGLITGTPTGAAAVYTATVTATDLTGAAGDAVITWTIGVVDRVTVTAPAKEQTWLGIPVSVKITAKDSDPAQTLTFSATGLPAGLSINPATGVISGKPQKITTAAATVTVTATDGAKFFGRAAVKWSVGYPVVIPNPGTVIATIGQAVNVAITDADIANKRAHVTLSATGLPRGLTFRANTPLIYGWPTATGTYRVTIHAKDSLGGISVMTFPLVVRFAANGPGGQILLALNGKCLNDPGNRTANGTQGERRELPDGSRSALDCRVGWHHPRARPLPGHRRTARLRRAARPALAVHPRAPRDLGPGHRRRARESGLRPVPVVEHQDGRLPHHEERSLDAPRRTCPLLIRGQVPRRLPQRGQQREPD